MLFCKSSQANDYHCSIVKLTEKLVETVKADDVSCFDSLIGAEFQNIVSSLEVVPKRKRIIDMHG